MAKQAKKQATTGARNAGGIRGRYARRRVAELVCDPANVRKHGEKNLEAIKASLTRFGQQKPIVIDSSGVVRAGNGTLAAAKALGWAEIDCVVSDLSGAEASAYAIADNRTAELAEWDEAVLTATLQSLEAEDPSLLLDAGYDPKELAKLVAQNAPEVVEDEVPEPPADPITKPGDLWLLGDHRLLCGDSTKAEDVARVMDGQKAALCFTSPPYNSMNGGYKTDYNGKRKDFYKSDVDARTEAEWVAFCDSVLTNVRGALLDEEAPVIWNVMYTANCRAGYGMSMFSGGHGLTVKETICWDKGMGFPTASKGILSRNWELVFVLSAGPKYRSTQGVHEVRWAKWDIPRPQKQHADHHATFPVELAGRALGDYSTGGIVYDPFLGSGTTLIAAEQLGRKCYGLEIDPAYCDVVVARWEKLTGKKAERVPA